jgi:hypothetical protein
MYFVAASWLFVNLLLNTTVNSLNSRIFHCANGEYVLEPKRPGFCLYSSDNLKKERIMRKKNKNGENSKVIKPMV